MISARTATGEAGSTAVLEARAQRAGVLGAMGRLEEGHAEYRALAEEYRRLLGPGHPGTLLMRVKRAETLRKMGLDARAAAEYGAVARMRMRTLDPGHPDTLLAREWHDSLLRKEPRPRGTHPV